MYRTVVEANIARLEHNLMIAGHEHECPACNGKAWPLEPPLSSYDPSIEGYIKK